MTSLLNLYKKLAEKIDLPFLIFIITISSNKIYLKIFALILVFILRPRFNLFFNKNLTLFYPLLIILSFVQFLFFGQDFSAGHLVVFAVGILYWLICYAYMHQTFLFVDGSSLKKIDNTLAVYILLNFSLCVFDYIRICTHTHTFTPFLLPEGEFGASTGDHITGLFGRPSYVNTIINSLFIIYFIHRRRMWLVLVAAFSAMISFANIINIVFLLVLFVYGIFANDTRKRVLVALVLLMGYLMYFFVSPHNYDYVKKTLSLAVTDNNEIMPEVVVAAPEDTAAEPETVPGPQTAVSAEAKPAKRARRVEHSNPAATTTHTTEANHTIPEPEVIQAEEVSETTREPEAEPAAHAHETPAEAHAHQAAEVSHATETSPAAETSPVKKHVPRAARTASAAPVTQVTKTAPQQELKYVNDSSAANQKIVVTDRAALLQEEYTSYKTYYPVDLKTSPGKEIAVQQTLAFMKEHPVLAFFGAGVGNFSSRLAFQFSGRDSSRLFARLPHYSHGYYFKNNLLVYDAMRKLPPEYHSIKHFPNNFFSQLLGEYGIIGFILFIVFYFYFFYKRSKNKLFFFTIFACVSAYLMLDYLFEFFNIMVIAEMLFFIDARKGEETSSETA